MQLQVVKKRSNIDERTPGRFLPNGPLAIAKAHSPVHVQITIICMILNSIIFIYSIQGHSRATWTYGTNPARPKSNLREFFHRKHKPAGGDAEDSTPESVYWPKDLLSKDFKNMRVLTYGYDSRVSVTERGLPTLHTATICCLRAV
jgi:hypothetical protein